VDCIQCRDLETRLHAAKSSKDAVTPEESMSIHKGYRSSVQNWRKRKRMVSLRHAWRSRTFASRSQMSCIPSWMTLLSRSDEV
jgi:hypothetical protein